MKTKADISYKLVIVSVLAIFITMSMLGVIYINEFTPNSIKDEGIVVIKSGSFFSVLFLDEMGNINMDITKDNLNLMLDVSGDVKEVSEDIFEDMPGISSIQAKMLASMLEVMSEPIDGADWLSKWVGKGYDSIDEYMVSGAIGDTLEDLNNKVKGTSYASFFIRIALFSLIVGLIFSGLISIFSKKIKLFAKEYRTYRFIWREDLILQSKAAKMQGASTQKAPRKNKKSDLIVLLASIFFLMTIIMALYKAVSITAIVITIIIAYVLIKAIEYASPVMLTKIPLNKQKKYFYRSFFLREKIASNLNIALLTIFIIGSAYLTYFSGLYWSTYTYEFLDLMVKMSLVVMLIFLLIVYNSRGIKKHKTITEKMIEAMQKGYSKEVEGSFGKLILGRTFAEAQAKKKEMSLEEKIKSRVSTTWGPLGGRMGVTMDGTYDTGSTKGDYGEDDKRMDDFKNKDKNTFKERQRQQARDMQNIKKDLNLPTNFVETEKGNKGFGSKPLTPEAKKDLDDKFKAELEMARYLETMINNKDKGMDIILVKRGKKTPERISVKKVKKVSTDGSTRSVYLETDTRDLELKYIKGIKVFPLGSSPKNFKMEELMKDRTELTELFKNFNKKTEEPENIQKNITANINDHVKCTSCGSVVSNNGKKRYGTCKKCGESISFESFAFRGKKNYKFKKEKKKSFVKRWFK